MRTREEVRLLTKKLIAKQGGNIGNNWIVVSIPAGQAQDSGICLAMWQHLQGYSKPNRLIVFENRIRQTAFSFGLLSKMHDEDYLEEWLTMATNLAKDPNGSANINVDSVSIIKIDYRPEDEILL